MSRIFLSHSSANNAEAVALRDWLNREGWNDVFLDIDPDRGIAAGERWERALNEAANRCEAVLFVVSRAWLASGWCLKEFNLAHRLNKRLFGLLVDDLAPADLPVNLTSTWQLVRLSAGRDHVMMRVTMPFTGEEAHVTFSAEALARLKTGLQRAGLDSRFFAWPPDSDPSRPPYRGLRPLEAEDAGIFFGRDAPIVEALDRLRGLRDAAPPRLLVILGASGAGKSSFLRAGLVPRIRRDDQNFLLLPVLRPERSAINGESGLVRSLETSMQAQSLIQTRADIKTAISGGAPILLPLLAKLADKARPPRLPGEPEGKPPSLVLPIDQGEELFLAEGATEAEPLLALMRDLLTADAPAVIVIFTMRSDSYERLQTAKSLDGISPLILNLSPLPKGAYQAVIEGPADRLKESPRALKIEPALTQALLADIEAGGGRDALPLLAFTLERLYLEYGGRGRLTFADYEALGRIKGSIEAAVERAMAAADADPKIPRDRVARLTLLRRGFIPWLAGIDSETGSPRRRVARMSEIPAEARPLIDLLVAQHLLATDVAQDTGEITIEPAHEALLRQWGLLQGWLEEDFGALTTLAGVQRAARDWAANNKDAAWLTHAGGRLEEAERLRARDDLDRLITPTEQDYLAQCRQMEDTERIAEQTRLARERRNLRRLRWALVAFFGAALFGVTSVLGVALLQSYQTSKREAAVFASAAAIASPLGFCDRALRLAVAGLPPSQGASPFTYRSPELEGDLSLYTSATECPFRAALSGHTDSVWSAKFSPDGSRVVTASFDHTARLWEAMTGAALATLSGHADFVVSAEFSPDGSRVVTASNDETARLWDAKTGAALATLSGHSGQVLRAVYSRDGSRVVTASRDATARLWNAKTGAALATLSGHSDEVNSAVFSPDGSRVVTASRDATARLWDAKTGAALATLSGHRGAVDSAVFSPDGSRVVTASGDSTARLWDAKTGAALATLSGHTGEVNSAEFSPDGSRVVTASWDHTARLWDAKTGAALATLSGHTESVDRAEFSPDGSRVVTASSDKTTRLWDAKTGAALATLWGHTKGVITAEFSADGSRVVTASDDRTARLWNVKTGAALTTLSGHTDEVYRAEFSPDGSRIVTASFDHTARLWDAKTGAALATLSGHTDNVDSAVFSPDGSRVVTASWDQTARLWDAKTGAALLALSGHTDGVYRAEFSPDGSRVVTASSDETARLWDAKTGAALATLSGHTSSVKSAEFSPDGSRVVTASWDHTARLWDAKTGAALALLSGHKDHVNNAEFSPDGSRVVTASSDHTARLWDAKTGAALATLSGHTGVLTRAQFSPDGSRVVSASDDNTARLWDAKTGAALSTLRGHAGPVFSAVFSPDGSRVVTASGDHTARLWDAKTGAALATLIGHTDSVHDAAFSSDGSRLVTASDDYTARVWLLDPIFLIEPGKRRDYVCRERLTGAQAFTVEEMQDPVLRDRDDLRNPCDRVGPLSFEYYARAASNLWSNIRGVAPRPVGN